MPARLELWIYAALFALAATLAWSAATTDSVTVDEPAHLVAGYASLRTGDFRLSPDHPPLARWLLALPFQAIGQPWAVERQEGWDSGDIFALGERFFAEADDRDQLLLASRGVAIVLFVALLAVVAWITRELLGSSAALFATTLVALDAKKPEHKEVLDAWSCKAFVEADPKAWDGMRKVLANLPKDFLK